MTTAVQHRADEVKALCGQELDELLDWLHGYTCDQDDEWDEEVERDSQPGGRLEPFLKRAREDIAADRNKPLCVVPRE